MLLLENISQECQTQKGKPKNIKQFLWMSGKRHWCFFVSLTRHSKPALGQNTDNDGGYRHSFSKLLPEEKARGVVKSPGVKAERMKRASPHKSCPEIANNVRRWRPVCSLSEWYRHCENQRVTAPPPMFCSYFIFQWLLFFFFFPNPSHREPLPSLVSLPGSHRGAGGGAGGRAGHESEGMVYIHIYKSLCNIKTLFSPLPKQRADEL